MKLACVQAPVVFNDPTANANYAVKMLQKLASQGVDLAVFPEAFLTGYVISDASTAAEISISADHPSILHIGSVCDELGIHAVVGFAANSNESGDLPLGLSNAVVLFQPNRPREYYAKTHLPELGLDKFVRPGNRLPVFDTALGRIGILICYDMRPPEATRSLVLNRADIILLPTNWPNGAQVSAEHVTIARAAENRVFFASCNRVGHENGFDFIGLSKIIHPTGKVLSAAGDREEVLMAELDFVESRQKRTVTIPGKYEIDVIGCRRPELYESLTDLLS